MYALAVPLRRRLAYIAASVIAGSGMFAGHTIAQRTSDPTIANWIGIGGWIVAGIAAVLIDRTVPARAVGLASLALPLVWFGMLLVSEDNALWMAGLAFLLAFAMVSGVSAGATKFLFRLTTRT